MDQSESLLMMLTRERDTSQKLQKQMISFMTKVEKMVKKLEEHGMKEL